MSVLTAVMPGLHKETALHAGEKYMVWDHLMKAKGCQSKYQLLKNHAEDPELIAFLDDITAGMVKKEVDHLESFLLRNGVEPPPGTPPNPRADSSKIPSGARFSDQEIAMCVYHDLAGAMASSTQTVSIAVREDVGRMFAAHHQEIAMQGAMLLKLMKKKGWLVEPPV